MKTVNRLGIVMLALAPVIAAVIPMAASFPVAASGITNAPLARLKNGTSTNWSGYAVEEATTANSSGLFGPENDAVTDVRGSWVVPAVVSAEDAGTSSTSHGNGHGKGHGQPTPSSTPSYSAAWVGIDGYSDGTVEQIGTEQDVIDGTPTYYAWFEMYPKFGYKILKPVSPGDRMSAEVQYVGNGVFALTLADRGPTNKWTFTTDQRSPSALRQSAEWIMEAPSSSGGILSLADFGTIKFSGAQATLNGESGAISDWPNDAITMETSTGTVEAVPSSLSAQGTSFDVTWGSN